MDKTMMFPVEKYTAGWICAKQVEVGVAYRMLDQYFETPENIPDSDHNQYRCGRIRNHFVVIGHLPPGVKGGSSAATVAQDMRRTFPRLKFVLMVGIGGGVPTLRDIRLGDVVVSVPDGLDGGVVPYDVGKRLSQGVFQLAGHLNKPPKNLLSAVVTIQQALDDPSETDGVSAHLGRIHGMDGYERPAVDRLFDSEYEHQGKEEDHCDKCNHKRLRERHPRKSQRQITVHQGRIASGNSVMRDAKARDEYARNCGILCFEMEAAGLMDNVPCLVIRGISDYCDSHKSDEWHKYAALVAAAYARQLLWVLRADGGNDLPSWENQTRDGEDGSSRYLLERFLNTSKRETEEERNLILDWLTTLDHSGRQNDHLRRRKPDTFEWFIADSRFQTWLRTENRTLFCWGSPGAGKTTLSSVVVDHLRSQYAESSNVGIAYIYCSFQEEKTVEDMLACLLKQLVFNRSPLSEAVKSLYDNHTRWRTRPTPQELSDTLLAEVQLLARVFIVVDALDECLPFNTSLKALLSELFSIQARGNMNLFTTSRPLMEISCLFHPSASLEFRASEDDLRIYVESSMGDLRKVVHNNTELQEKIKQTIPKAADGIFLLAELYFGSLSDKICANDIEFELKDFEEQGQDCGEDKAAVLDNYYGRVMNRIERQKPGLRTLAMKVLSWLTHARRPLTISEVCEALATKPGKSALNNGDFPTSEDIISTCAGLVVVDARGIIIRLIHYTAQQYLSRKQCFSTSESNIAETCLTYQMFAAFESGRCMSNEELKQRLESNRFYGYATRNWGYHAQRAGESLQLSQAITRFLQDDAKVEASAQVLFTDLQHPRQHGHSESVPRGFTGLHLMALLGVTNIAPEILSGNRLNARDSRGRTPLSYAVEKGHIEFVTLLLNNGADIDSRDSTGWTPLLMAALRRWDDIADLLVARGAKYNLEIGCQGHTPLTYAASIGNEQFVKILLSKGANPDGKDPAHKRTPLIWAAKNGHLAVVRLLLDKKVNLEAYDQDLGQTALMWASKEGHIPVVDLLQERGANFPATDSDVA